MYLCRNGNESAGLILLDEANLEEDDVWQGNCQFSPGFQWSTHRTAISSIPKTSLFWRPFFSLSRSTVRQIIWCMFQVGRSRRQCATCVGCCRGLLSLCHRHLCPQRAHISRLAFLRQLQSRPEQPSTHFGLHHHEFCLGYSLHSLARVSGSWQGIQSGRPRRSSFGALLYFDDRQLGLRGTICATEGDQLHSGHSALLLCFHQHNCSHCACEEVAGSYQKAIL